MARSLSRLRSTVELLQRTLAVLGVAVDALDVSGAGRLANVLQAVVLTLTAVLVVLVFLTRLALGQTVNLTRFVVTQLAVNTLALLAFLVGTGALSTLVSLIHESMLSVDGWINGSLPIRKHYT